MDVQIEPSWKEVLRDEFEKPYFRQLTERVRQAYATGQCFPPAGLIFNAFNLTPFDRVKVVIVGQDPYHNVGQAMGLAFSVPRGVMIPPSLDNIYKELADDLEVARPTSGDLTHWARQGVFLPNATLTVQAHQARSHHGWGWERFTDRAIELLAERREHLVFILWGADAQTKARFIDPERHLILKAPHPSPLSAYRGFFGSKPFSRTNDYLLMHHIPLIRWLEETPR